MAGVSGSSALNNLSNKNGVTGPIQYSGLLQEGVTLKAPTVTGDPDGDASNPNYQYQWFLNGKAIANAVQSSFTTKSTGAGAYSVQVTYSDAKGNRATLPTVAISVAQKNNGDGTFVNPLGTTSIYRQDYLPTIYRQPNNYLLEEGVILVAPNIQGDPDGDANNPNYKYQWLLNGSEISGANNGNYATRSNGAGQYSVRVTYTDAQGYTSTLTTSPITVNKTNNGNGKIGSIYYSDQGRALSAKLVGPLKEGVTLIAPEITGDPDGDANNPNYTYQWLLNGNVIAGATGSTYATNSAGKYSVKITSYTDAQGYTSVTPQTSDVIVVGKKIAASNKIDILTGSYDNNFFEFRYGNSSALLTDQVTNFKFGADKISLLSADGNRVIPNKLSRAVDNNAASNLNDLVKSVFADADGAQAGNQALGTNQAVIVVSTNSAIKGTYLIINDSNAGFQSGSDLVINLTGYTGVLPGLGASTPFTIFS